MRDVLPGVWNIEFIRGDTWSRSFVFKEGEGTLYDISGGSWASQIRHTPDSTTIVHWFTITVDPATSILMLSLTADQTATVKKNTFYDVQHTSDDGVVRTLIRGAVIVDPDVTRL